MNRFCWAFFLLPASCCGPEPDRASRDPYERYLGVRELAAERTAASVAEAVRLLDDPHPLVAVGALETLADYGDKDFLQHVVPKLKAGAPLVRAQACAVVASLGNPDGAAPLLEVLKDPDPAVRRAAVKALAAFGSRPEVRRALVEAVGDKDASVALMAHTKLQELTGRTDVARTRDAWAATVP
jgi:HEAT repeat protein